MCAHQLVHPWPKAELEGFPSVGASQVQEPVQHGPHVFDHLQDGVYVYSQSVAASKQVGLESKVHGSDVADS